MPAVWRRPGNRAARVSRATAFLLSLLLVVAARPASSQSKEFVTSALVAGVATIYDIETTFYGLREPGVYETSGLMRPFVEAGRIPTYAVALSLTMGQVWLGEHLRHKEYWWWWMIPAIPTALHLYAGTMNLKLVASLPH